MTAETTTRQAEASSAPRNFSSCQSASAPSGGAQGLAPFKAKAFNKQGLLPRRRILKVPRRNRCSYTSRPAGLYPPTRYRLAKKMLPQPVSTA